jgi:hypothetical protein
LRLVRSANGESRGKGNAGNSDHAKLAGHGPLTVRGNWPMSDT